MQERIQEKTKIVYDPRPIIEYVKEKGLATYEDIVFFTESLGFDSQEAQLIFFDLRRLGWIDVEPNKEKESGEAVFSATKLADRSESFFKSKTIIKENFPVFSKLGTELVFEFIKRAGKDHGIELELLEKMVRARAKEAEMIAKEVASIVLTSSSPDALRDFADELKRFAYK